MFFFKAPAKLKRKAPQRYGIIEKLARDKGIKMGG